MKDSTPLASLLILTAMIVARMPLQYTVTVAIASAGTALLLTTIPKHSVVVLIPYILIPVVATLVPLPIANHVPVLIKLALVIGCWGTTLAVTTALTLKALVAKTTAKSIR